MSRLWLVDQRRSDLQDLRETSGGNQTMNKDTVRQLLVIIATLATLVVNGLSEALPLNGLTSAEIANRYPIYFLPANYVFSIWGVIYLGMIAFTISSGAPGAARKSAAAEDRLSVCRHRDLQLHLAVPVPLRIIRRQHHCDGHSVGRADRHVSPYSGGTGAPVHRCHLDDPHPDQHLFRLDHGGDGGEFHLCIVLRPSGTVSACRI